MSAGEVGCYASHLVVAQQIVARGLPYAVVLEDDVELAPDFKAIIRAAIDAVPTGWDLFTPAPFSRRPSLALVRCRTALASSNTPECPSTRQPMSSQTGVRANACHRWCGAARLTWTIDMRGCNGSRYLVSIQRLPSSGRLSVGNRQYGSARFPCLVAGCPLTVFWRGLHRQARRFCKLRTRAPKRRLAGHSPLIVARGLEVVRHDSRPSSSPAFSFSDRT